LTVPGRFDILAVVRRSYGLVQPPASSSNHPEDPETGRDVFVQVTALPTILREDIEDAPFWKEVVAFANLPQSILDPYFGKYVAVYGGNIVDSDTDEGELALRFYRTFGYVPVYIHKVGVEDNLIDVNE
jgi:hypothetical protein